ncbi:39S ribosomal protein L54, mitochondrial-like [Ceratina calcarata]|uniref:Large ribosomal subunit protein mL54 n=1 Tax=Ceratina calcarata TaxID=156304 RepID=A0AAJ7J285_9HYME|nr:39S ribosomal protein L54, mitochondrial-like [Ceratina calcarata]
MSLLTVLRLSRIGGNVVVPAQYAIQTKNYAAPIDKRKQRVMKSQKIHLPVEKDVNKLINYCCGSNIYKEGEDIKLKPDSEYPEWLWNIRTEPPKLSDLDPNTKQYWRYIRKRALLRKNQMLKFIRPKYH